MVDYHIHSTFSDGEETVETLICKAKALGLRAIAITDHFDDHDPAHNQKTLAQLKEHFAHIRKCSKAYDFPVYCGVETCTDEHGNFAHQNELLECCDIIITSPHYFPVNCTTRPGEYFNDDYWQAYKQTVLAMARGKGDVLGHPEGYLPLGPLLAPGTTYEGRKEICRKIADHYFDLPYIELLAEALLQSGKACEIHGATGTPREWVIQKLNEYGIPFSMGSDAHALTLLGRNERAQELTERYHLKLYHPIEKER